MLKLTLRFKFSGTIECVPSHNEILIPFFPLPPTFDHTNRGDWASLSKEIEKWLVQLDTGLPQWTWGRDAFWLAFVAAFPFFPRGTWPLWNPHVPLEGAFIEKWLEASGQSTTVGQETLVIDLDDADNLGEIWEAFRRDAALFYPYPLISAV